MPYLPPRLFLITALLAPPCEMDPDESNQSPDYLPPELGLKDPFGLELKPWSERPAKGLACREEPPNLIWNGAFDLPPVECGWDTLDLTFDGILVLQVCEVKEKAGCFAVLSTGAQGEAWLAQLTQGVNLEPDTYYLLRFKARAEGKRRVTVALRAESPAEEERVFLKTLSVSNHWRAYEFSFISPPVETETHLIFAFGADKQPLHLDTIEIVPDSPHLEE